MTSRRNKTRPAIFTWLVALLVVLLMMGGVIIQRFWPHATEALINGISASMKSAGPWGALALAVAQILIAASGLLPASLLGLAAGALYGMLPGFALVSISTLAGGILAFRLSRSLFRPRIELLLAKRPSFADLDMRVAEEKWRLVCLLRVSPIMPFAATSYALGLSSVAEKDYILGTLTALPALLGYVLLGRLARSGVSASTTGATALHWVLLTVGIIGTIAATLSVSRLIARTLRGPKSSATSVL